MANTYSVVYNAKMEVNETLDLGLPLVTNPTLLHTSTLTAVKGTLTGSTVPPIEVFWESVESIASGATTNLDLTALVRTANLPNVDMTGYKINLVKLIASSANTTSITVDENAATGYNLFGTAGAGGTHQIVLGPGDCYLMYSPENRDAVAAGAKDFDLTNSAGATATVEVLIGAGVT